MLFVRMVNSLTRCLRAAGATNVAASHRWAGYARNALRNAPPPAGERAAALRAIDALLLAVPSDPCLAAGVARLRRWTALANPAVSFAAVERALASPLSPRGALLRVAGSDVFHGALRCGVAAVRFSRALLGGIARVLRQAVGWGR